MTFRSLVPMRMASLALLLAAVGCGASEAGVGSTDDLAVSRGRVEPRLLLTGQLEAVESVNIGVPRTPQWQVQVSWLVEDGSEVDEGDPVAEFDATPFAANLEEKRLAVDRAARSVEQLEAEIEARLIRARREVERTRVEVAKTELDASVPVELLSRREANDRRVALERARATHAKAVNDLEVARQAGEAELAVKMIELDTARREVGVAEAAIAELSVRAPRSGIALVAEHPWERRPIQEGDSLWVGLAVARIPNLSRMRVRARLFDVDDGLLLAGARVACSLDAYPDRLAEGVVREVTPVAVEAGFASLRRFFDVLVDLDSTDPSWMRPGMSVRVVAPLPPEDGLVAARGCLDLEAVPPRARLAGGSWREVSLGACSATACVVRDGLDEGDRLAPAGGEV